MITKHINPYYLIDENDELKHTKTEFESIRHLRVSGDGVELEVLKFLELLVQVFQ